MSFDRPAALALIAMLALRPLAGGAREVVPEDSRQHLRFADLEFAMPADPLLWSSDPGWKPHATSPQLLADARAQLRHAVPVGSLPQAAAAVLGRAGARCAPPSDGALVCRYQDVENPWGGDYHDRVTWTVTIALPQGRVGGLELRREWTRR